MYRTLLHAHNNYITNVIAIMIEELHPTVAETKIKVKSKKAAIKLYLQTKTTLIKSMERSNNSRNKGKWFFIVKKSNTKLASDFLNKELQDLYQVVPTNLRFNQ
eukprot:11212158-Ditylum_brightwellii.AAC.1